MHGGKSKTPHAEPVKGRDSEPAETEGFCAETELSEDWPVLESSTLFGGRKQVVIGHNGCRYVLRITRYGKLVLNK